MSEVICHISNGEIVNKKAIAKAFSELGDGRYVVKITKANKRSLDQNAYMHGVLIPEFKNALRSVGYDEVKTNDQAKLIMKSMFLTDHIVNKETGEGIPYVKDTHELTTIEMSALFEEVIKFCAEKMSYQIPFPNEQLIMNI
jgi:hypothetical protein